MDSILQSPLFAAIAAGAAAFLISVAVGLLVLEGAQRRGRLKALTGRRRGRLVAQRERNEAAERWRKDAIRVVRATTRRMNVVRDQQIKTVRQRLVRAGYRARDAVLVYAFAKIVLPLVLAGAIAFFIFFVQPLNYSLVMQVAIILVGGLAGSMLPDLWVKNAEQRRRTQIRFGLPDTLDLMVICAESGLSLDASLARVSSELGRTSPVMADEITYTGLELRFLSDRRRALENMAERNDLPAMRSLSSTLIQTEKYGTPLAQALRVLATEQRAERMLKAEEKAARLPAVMTVPLIVFILPALFVVILGPGALIMMDELLSHW